MTTNLTRVTSALILAFSIFGMGALPHVAEAATIKTAPAVATASIDPSSLAATPKAKPSFVGDATNVKTLRLVVEDSSGKRMFKSKIIKVRNDHWKVTGSKKLKAGTYMVTVYDAKDKKQKTLASGNLVVSATGSNTSNSGTKSTGLISVSALGLLSGGTASPGASVPVAYLRVQNTTDAAVQLEGFTLKQNGSASGDSVIGFSTNDDKGGSRAIIGGVEGVKQFKNGTVYVPLSAAILPGTVRIFTIKATMSRNPGADLGKQLFVDVEGVTSNGSVKASYPIRGVAWTVIR